MKFLSALLTALMLALPASAQTAPGSADMHWDEGAADCATHHAPPLQVHAYNKDTFILRETQCATFVTTSRREQRLRERVLYTAHALCNRLDRAYPVNAADEPQDAFGSSRCYGDAVEDGMNQADAAIARARGNAD